MSAEILALLARGTIAASLAILIVLALRGPARRAFGARAAYAFWLIVPVTVVAAYLPARVIVAPASEHAPPPDELPALLSAHIGPTEMVGSSVVAAPTGLPWADILFFIWLGGFIASLMALLIDQQRMLARMALVRQGNVYRARCQSGPAVVGIVAPRLVLPSDFEHRYDETERRLVIEHERAHIRAGDAQINAIAAFAQCLVWFNPLVYIARKALRVDQELACDERVMRRHGHARRAYAEAMLKTQLASHAIPLGCHWPALGMKPLKQRIAMLGQAERPRAAQLAGFVSCAAAASLAAFAAWIAQPPQVAYAQTNDRTLVSGPLGAQLVSVLQVGRETRARELINAGADVNFFLPGDGTPLIMAVRDGDRDMVAQLIAAGADVNQPAPGDGNALIVAAAEGELEIAELLVSAGADVNGFVRADETPLINAARENRLNVARYLIQRGADVNLEVDAPAIRGLERRSPMSVARERGHDEMIRLLREHGARG